MGTSRKIHSSSKFKPNSSLKRNGFIWQRFVFTAFDSDTGSESLFFIELEMINASLSPDTPILGFKQRTKISESDLQYALAGTDAAHNLQSEQIVTPSYVAVRAGALGKKSKQVCEYFSLKDVTGGFKLSPIEVGKCRFSDDRIAGELFCSKEDISNHPEYMCDVCSLKWDLRYEIQSQFLAGYKRKAEIWMPFGARSSFSGIIIFNGREYSVYPKKSFGYIDVHFLNTLPQPYFHLSSSNLTSLISGKTLFNSNFCVQGVYNDSISLVLKFEDIEVIVPAKQNNKDKPLWSCVEMPADETGERLHWSVSVNTKKWVIDIDVICYTSELSIRNIELPCGKRNVMKLLEGGTGTGGVKLYKHIGKNLELIEDAHIAFALCEFGQFEEGEI